MIAFTIDTKVAFCQALNHLPVELRCEIWKNLVNIIEEDETKVPPQAPMKKRKVN